MDQIVKECIAQALVYLSIREHNRVELETKLKKKNFNSTTIDEAFAFLIEEGSFSEERYAESFVRSNNKRHPEGKSVVYARLLSKGCDRTVARKTVDTMYDSDYVVALISSASEKLKKKGKSEELKLHLMKLGFSFSDIALISDSL